MIIDNLSLLCGSYAAGVLTGQSVALGLGASAVSQNVYDTFGGDTINTGGQAVDLGDGRLIPIDIAITQTVVGAGGSLEFQYVTADDAALSVNVTPIQSTGAVPVTNLTAGAILPLDIVDAGPRTVRRYVGIRIINSGAATTAGAVVAAMVTNHVNIPYPAYKSGFAVQ